MNENENKNVENEVLGVESKVADEENVQEVEETAIATVQDLSGLSKRTDTKGSIFTNITDKKKLFNLDNKVDNLLNDCENELIHVKEVVIKRYEKPMKKPEINEETGEIIKDKEISMACVLVDKEGKSYATGSKIFTIQMMRYLEMFGLSDEGFIIKVTKTKQESGNKTLGFELV